MREKNYPNVYITQEGIGEYTLPKRVYTAQEGIEETKNNLH